MKNQSSYAKICKRLRVFLPQIYPDSHIFYLILQQENQELAYAMHQGCPTGAFGSREEQPSASNC